MAFRPRPQQYRLQWPLTPSQVEAIDTMFETLFKAVRGDTLEVNVTGLAGVIGVPHGGTGISSYVVGDILYASATTTLARLADIAVGNALISGGVGVAPSWGKITLTSHVSGVLPVANGGTNISSYVVGDLLYASGATTLSKLPDVATGNALISGGVTTAPAWGKVGLTTHISGVLPIANGGTNGSATPTAGEVPYGTGTAYAFTTGTIAGKVLTSQGAAPPTWETPSGGVTMAQVLTRVFLEG